VCSLRWLLWTCFILVSARAFAEESDFSRLARLIESRYQVQRVRVPLWGVIKPMVKSARPLGAKGLDMAVFEDLNPDLAGSSDGFESLMKGSLEPKWQSMVRVFSRRGGEQSYIYSKTHEKDFRLMIFTLDNSGAVLLEFKLKPAQLVEWLRNPELIGKRVQHGVEDELEE